MGDTTNIKILCREIIKEVEEKDTKIHKLEEIIDKAMACLEKHRKTSVEDYSTIISFYKEMELILKGADEE